MIFRTTTPKIQRQGTPLRIPGFEVDQHFGPMILEQCTLHMQRLSDHLSSEMMSGLREVRWGLKTQDTKQKLLQRLRQEVSGSFGCPSIQGEVGHGIRRAREATSD